VSPVPAATSHTLEVPGARLHYEVQGTGPVLMLVGHPMGATGFAAIAPLLAEAHTVVTYDPRGFAGSSIDDPDQDAEPDLMADDVRRVLEAVGEGPACVFGSSGGAVTGLALAANHPGQVQTLVAHEPPVVLLLDAEEGAAAGIHDTYETYLEHGTGAAWARFSAVTGMTVRPQSGNAEPEPPTPEAVATSERFFAHGLLPIALYEPDLAALTSGAARVVVAGGTTSRGELAQRTAAALAARLGTRLVEFPGGHAGFSGHPADFARVLLDVLRSPAAG
jgi:pimeloyl-ACP methyl ester carboxylesterase